MAMTSPPVTQLLKQAECRYTLVVKVAKRARQLLLDNDRLNDRKPVSVAVDELYGDKLDMRYPEDYRQ